MSANTIDLDLLINNSPIELKVPGVGKVEYRMPNKGDRIEAEKVARKHPFWKDMEDLEKVNERTIQLVLQILVKPKIEYEKYMKAREDYMEAVVQIVAMDLAVRTEALRDKRSKIMSAFLEQMKAKAQETSTGS